MSMERAPILGAILAGGRSSRMGTPKGAVLVDGAPMGALVRAALTTVCGEICQVGGEGADIDDSRDGPLRALLALLRARPDRMVLVAPVDQPRLAANALRPLIAACGVDDGVCWAALRWPRRVAPSRAARRWRRPPARRGRDAHAAHR